MANEVPGVRVPDALMERMRAPTARRRPRPRAFKLRGRSPAGLRTMVQGIQVSTQSGNIDAALAVVDGLR